MKTEHKDWVALALGVAVFILVLYITGLLVTLNKENVLLTQRLHAMELERIQCETNIEYLLHELNSAESKFNQLTQYVRENSNDYAGCMMELSNARSDLNVLSGALLSYDVYVNKLMWFVSVNKCDDILFEFNRTYGELVAAEIYLKTYKERLKELVYRYADPLYDRNFINPDSLIRLIRNLEDQLVDAYMNCKKGVNIYAR